MTDAHHVYSPPASSHTSMLPQGVQDFLNGENLDAKTQAVRISTVNEDGWPHASLLSAGDMLALPPGRIRFACFARSTMTANLRRDGRVTITLALDGGMCELRMRCVSLVQASPELPLALFEAALVEVRHHKAPYASVSGGVTFALSDPNSVLPRWRKQIETMRSAT